MKVTKKYVNDVAYKIVGCAIEVHKHLGPGLLESVYHTCLMDELLSKELNVLSQVHIPIRYKERDLGGVLKLDLLVENLVIVELKSVELMNPVYKAQLISYLKLADKPKGLLVNFNCENITSQLIPIVSESFANLPEF